MKVLITGSSGLVGSACFDHFTKQGHAVLGLDNNMRSKLFGTPEQEVKNNVDIRDTNMMQEVFLQFQPEVIIHAAAQPSHDWSLKDPVTDFDINARATLVLLECARQYTPNALFVHVSTDKVYGENMKRKLVEKKTRYHSDKPFDEKIGLDFAGHRSLFGCSKLAADAYAQEYIDLGLKVGIFRAGCITGKKHQGAEQHGFLAYLAKCIKEGKEYTIYGYKGKQVRDQIHAYDLASVFEAWIKDPKPGVYNIGGGEERSVSILEAGEELSKRLKRPFNYTLGKKRAGDRQWDVHDITKFKKDYPEWDYKYSLEDTYKDLCQ